MKLAKIDHYQCDEWNSSSYVWIPDDMDKTTFCTIVSRISNEYIAYLKDWNPTESVPYVGFTPDYKKYPSNLTIEEINAQHKIALAKYIEWEAKVSKSKRKFSAYLAEAGFKELWDYEPDIATTLQWGHNHGLGLDYAEEYPKDFSLLLDESEDDF